MEGRSSGWFLCEKKIMSHGTQRQRRNEKTFEDIPSEIVIHEILNYHEVKLKSYIREFDLFGYFRGDCYRNVWFLFQSLYFWVKDGTYIRDNMTFPVVKLEKLISFQIDDPFNVMKIKHGKGKFLRGIIKRFKRTNMYLLKRFSINFSSSEHKDFNGLFSSQNQFKKLKHLEITNSGGYISRDWKWDEQRIASLQETLLSIRIYGTGGSGERLPDTSLRIFGNGNSLSSLKRISLTRIRFVCQRTIHIPYLEEVYVCDLRNLVIIPGSNVSSISLEKIPPNDIKELFIRSKRIKYLTLSSFELFYQQYSWICGKSTKHLKNLTFLGLSGCNSILIMDVETPDFIRERYENFKLFFERIKGQLIEFEISNCTFREDFFDQRFEKLEKLRIFRISSVLRNKRNWKFANQLKELSLVNSDVNEMYIRSSHRNRHKLINNNNKILISKISIRSNLFSKNNFSSLEVLEMINCKYSNPEVKNISFPPLKNLKFIRANNVILNDNFFIDHDFENLEVLVFVGHRSSILTGKGWRRTRFNKLREIKIKNDVVTSDLFKLIEFPALRKLELEWCWNVTGEGWFAMPNLFEACITNCGVSEEKIMEIQKKDVNYYH